MISSQRGKLDQIRWSGQLDLEINYTNLFSKWKNCKDICTEKDYVMG